MAGKTLLHGEPAPDPQGADLRPGALLGGRWRIEGVIGTGGMGSVYRAEHVHVGRRAAVKVLHADLSRNEPERERFRREARVASRLHSPHVVEVLDFGEDTAGRPYLVMELLEGESLRAVLEREHRLAPQRVVRLMRQLLDGLGAAHGEGIVHRDLKPENLWLSGSGDDELLRVLDFGIAKWSDTRAGDATRTQAGLVVGTPEYLSPEQAVGGDVDRRADLYAAGILAFVMLTGQHPFDTSDLRALVAAHAFERVPIVSSVAPELAAWPKLVDFVTRATEKDRARRPKTAAELRALLDGADAPVRRPTGRSGKVVPAQRPRDAARASFLGVPSAALPATANLTLVAVRIVPWEERSPSLSPVARARALADHDAVVLPIVRAYGGVRLACEDGGALFAFRSPTDAVEFAAAAQDAATRANAQPYWSAALGVGVHQGEVRIEAGALSGRPLATVRAVAACASPGEVWLSRVVSLTMARIEAPSEEMGPRMMDGEPDAVVLYRLVRDRGELPYGGRHLARAGGARRSALLEPVRTTLASIQVAGATEGRARATARVLAAAAGLAGTRAVTVATSAADLVVRGLVQVAAAVRRRGDGTPPALLADARAALARTQRSAAERRPGLALALRRPLRAPKLR
jgi:serine/threonine-protein kinase